MNSTIKIIMSIFLCIILVLVFASCKNRNDSNVVFRDLSDYDLKFNLPGVTGQILEINYYNYDSVNEEDAFVNLIVEWSEFKNYNRESIREAESYYLGFSQNDKTYYKLIIPANDSQERLEVTLNETKLLPYEIISVDLFKVNRGEFPQKEFVIHLFNIPAD